MALLLFVLSGVTTIREPRSRLVAVRHFSVRRVLAADQRPELRPVGVNAVELRRDM